MKQPPLPAGLLAITLSVCGVFATISMAGSESSRPISNSVPEFSVPRPVAPDSTPPEFVAPEFVAPEPVASEFVAPEAVGSAPLGSGPGPVGSAPDGSRPVGSRPVGSEPVGSEPVGSEPVGSEPVGSGPVDSGPVDSGPVAPTWPAWTKTFEVRADGSTQQLMAVGDNSLSSGWYDQDSSADWLCLEFQPENRQGWWLDGATCTGSGLFMKTTAPGTYVVHVRLKEATSAQPGGGAPYADHDNTIVVIAR